MTGGAPLGTVASVARWAGDVRERLTSAAQQLVAEHGFDATTVGAIARRAGVAESSFYRHFPDKGAVLQPDAAATIERLSAAVRSAPAGATAMHAAGAAVEDLCRGLEAEPDAAVALAAAIAASASLRERELVRHAALADAVAAALQERGVAPATAGLTASTVMLVLRAATADWVAGDGSRRLPHLFLARLEDLGRAFAE